MAPPPHIAVLFENYPPPEMPGTAELLALEACGCRVTAVSLTPPRFGAPAEDGAVRAEVLYPPQPAVLELPRRFPPDDAAWRAMTARAVATHDGGAPECAAWHFASALHRRGVQLIHVPGGRAALRAAALMRQSGIPFSFTASAALCTEPEFPAWMAAADLIMATSDATAAALREAHPAAAQKVVTVRPGIDASRYPAALCGGAGALRVLFFPGDSGTAGVMEAMHRLHALGHEAELTLTELRSAAETKRLLAAADVCVLGSGHESGLLEAMAAGLPVVSLGEPGDPLQEGRTGWQIPGGDTAALTQRLATLAAQPALRSTTGQAGLDRVQAHFSLGRRAARMVEEFRRVLEGRFAPAVAARDTGVLCLLAAWPAPAEDGLLADELRFLIAQPGVELLAARLQGSSYHAPPAGMEYLPDAPVLEAAWQAHPGLAEKALALRSLCPAVNGEDFLLHARRAVLLAALRAARGWHHVHALRSDTFLTAWLVRRLTGMTASAVLEPGHALPPATLTPLADAFAFGSSAGALPASGVFSNEMHPPAPAARRLMGLFSAAPAPAPAVDAAAVWQRWLQRARSAAPH